MGTWEHIKLGELPWHNALSVFLLGSEIPQNTHKNKKGVVYIHLHIFWGMFQYKFIGLNIIQKKNSPYFQTNNYFFCKQEKRLIFCRPARTIVPNILLLNLMNELFVGMKFFMKNFCGVTKVQMVHPKEREREASLIDKEKSTYPQRKGRRNTKRRPNVQSRVQSQDNASKGRGSKRHQKDGYL